MWVNKPIFHRMWLQLQWSLQLLRESLNREGSVPRSSQRFRLSFHPDLDDFRYFQILDSDSGWFSWYFSWYLMIYDDFRFWTQIPPMLADQSLRWLSPRAKAPEPKPKRALSRRPLSDLGAKFVEKNAPDSMKFLEELGTSFFVFWILWIFHEIHMYSLFLARPKWGTQPQPTHSNVGQFSSGSLVAMVGHDHFFQERKGGIWDATRKNEWKKVFQPKVRFEPLWGHQNGITWATRNRTAQKQSATDLSLDHWNPASSTRTWWFSLDFLEMACWEGVYEDNEFILNLYDTYTYSQFYAASQSFIQGSYRTWTSRAAVRELSSPASMSNKHEVSVLSRVRLGSPDRISLKHPAVLSIQTLFVPLVDSFPHCEVPCSFRQIDVPFRQADLSLSLSASVCVSLSLCLSLSLCRSNLSDRHTHIP